MQKKPLILVVNDDGINAPGIRHLIYLMNQIGEVVVVAPEGAQSGMGHAITLNSTLRCDEVFIDDGPQREFSCSGTPVDCVKLAVTRILDRKPDLCVSGINHGANHSINVIYSGTMSAAVEGALEGIPSIGFSSLNYAHDANLEPCSSYILNIAQRVLKEGLPSGVCLNVNFPKGESFEGVKVCRQARANWEEEFDKREDPTGRTYYWLTGKFVNYDEGDDTDVVALANNYVTVVPVQFDMTSHKTINSIKDWQL